jgi:hypothetical protein
MGNEGGPASKAAPGNLAQFARESVLDVWDEILPLALEHHDEIGSDIAGPFCPDRKRYEDLDKAGVVHVFTTRATDTKKLLGYCSMMIFRHMHFQKTLMAMQDVLYVSPQFRGLHAARFVAWVDLQLVKLGAEVVHREVRVHPAPDYSPLLVSYGYEKAGESYWRKL